MRLVIVAGVLVLAAGSAGGAWLAELDGGDRMTVDSYWEDGDRMHLMRDGMDVSVPRRRVRRLTPVEEPLGASRPAAPRAQAPAAKADDAPSREELEAQQAVIEKHLLRVQQERFEAQARGDDAATVKRLSREFKRTQGRRLDTIRALEKLDYGSDPRPMSRVGRTRG